MKRRVSYADFIDILNGLLEKEQKLIYYPLNNGHLSNTSVNKDLKNFSLLNIRTIEPIKLLFFPVKDSLVDKIELKQRIGVGIKWCDIQAIKVLDKIFLSDYVDESYKNYREQTLIITTDCINPQQNCFCSLVGGKPYVEQKDGISDLNISFVDDNNLILESFSLTGDKFLQEYFNNFDEPTKTEELQRDSNREVANKKIFNHNIEFLKEENEKYYKTLKHTYEFDKIWDSASEKCVQCGGCNFICPSCYCFLIREASESFENQFRDKVWDVCHFTGYARVAGGANPRKYKYQRFRNRYQCKFVYRYENFGFYACTGCGRCIDVCPAKIDIRKVIRSLVLAKGEEVIVKK